MTPLTSSTASGSTSRFAEAHHARSARRAERDDDHQQRRASKCDDGDHCEGPRRSPLLKALVQALREVLAAPTTTTGTAEAAAKADGTKAATSAKSAAGAVSTAEAKAAKAAAAAKATDTTAAAESVKTDAVATEAAAEVDKAPAAAGGDALEQALTAFARALMQALRGGDEGRSGHRGHGHGHHFGRREGMGWGDDPAQRLDKLASMVAQAALGTAPAKPTAPATAPTSGSTAGSSASAGTASTASTAATAAATAATATDEAQPVTEAAAAPAPAPTTLVLEIRLVPGVSSASPWARAADDLVSAFGSLQQALGRGTAAEGSEGSVRDQLTTFLRNLAARVRGDDAAMAEVEPTRPGALLSVTA
jgi:hypothetical protein